MRFLRALSYDPSRNTIWNTILSNGVWRILLHSALFGLAASVADLLFNFYVVSLGYSVAVAGLFSTIYRMAGVVFGLPIGMLIDRTGARRSLILGVSGYAGGWALLLISHELWALAVTQFMIGAASILALTAVVPMLTGITRAEQRPAIFGFNAAAGMMIGMLGSSMGGLLPSLAAIILGTDPHATASYRMALGSVILLGLVAALPVLRGVHEVERSTATAPSDHDAERTPRSRLVHFGIASLFLGIAAGMILPFQNLFFRQQFALSDAAVGVVLAWSAVGMGIGAILGAPVSRRLGLRRASAMTRMLSAPVILLMLVPVLFPAAAGFLLRGLFIGASYPISDALLMQTTPIRQRGTAMSMLSIVWSLGWSVAALISGWVQVNWGFAPVIICCALALAISSLSLWTIRIDESK